MSDPNRSEPTLPSEPKPVVMKGVPIAGQAEKLVRVRREITRADEMTRIEQIEHEAHEKAEEILKMARTEAEATVAGAQGEADSLRSKARQDGDLAAKREALQKLAALISNLEVEIKSLQRARADFLAANLADIIDFSCAMARKILVGELQARPKVIAERARELIDRLPPESKVTITVSSQDLDVIETYLQEAGGPADVLQPSLRSDPELETGSLRFDSDTGRIDAGFLVALEEMGKILTDQAEHVSGIKRHTPEEQNGG